MSQPQYHEVGRIYQKRPEPKSGFSTLLSVLGWACIGIAVLAYIGS